MNVIPFPVERKRYDRPFVSLSGISCRVLDMARKDAHVSVPRLPVDGYGRPVRVREQSSTSNDAA